MAHSNKEILQAAMREFNNHADRSGWFAFHDDAVKVHGLAPATLDKAGMKGFYNALWTAFPDLTIAIDDLVAEGNEVVWRISATGTHKGAFQGVQATDKSVKFGAHYTFVFDGGKIVERWSTIDRLTLLMQIGALTLPINK